MRKPEEIAKRYKNFIVAATEEEVVRIIKQIQVEAIEETVKRCAENMWHPIKSVNDLPQKSIMQDGHWINEFLVKNNNQMGMVNLVSVPDIHGNFTSKGEYIYKHHLESNCEFMRLDKDSILQVADKLKKEL